ncbi:hypothetical protein O181_042500 [Austropuccinia psidii MF-1]|uniref:Uncharacterized protein n=1 Tax=Austropuccinia psidii MF-1 TaxID=1389203 RepID=A0A9Q3DGS1_9BASI|nr:hypothetical protein [Austropuccinia psidii MF-1]
MYPLTPHYILDDSLYSSIFLSFILTISDRLKLTVSSIETFPLVLLLPRLISLQSALDFECFLVLQRHPKLWQASFLLPRRFQLEPNIHIVNMTQVQKSTVNQPIIKDVETLKANLKEEKRARAEAEADRNGDQKEIVSALEQPTEAQDEQRRKRRKVLDIVDHTSATEPSEETGSQDDDGPILDAPLTAQSEKNAPHSAEAAAATDATSTTDPKDSTDPKSSLPLAEAPAHPDLPKSPTKKADLTAVVAPDQKPKEQAQEPPKENGQLSTSQGDEPAACQEPEAVESEKAS